MVWALLLPNSHSKTMFTTRVLTRWILKWLEINTALAHTFMSRPFRHVLWR